MWSNRTDVTVNKGTTSFPVVGRSIYIGVYGGEDANVANAILSRKNPGANLNGDTNYTIEDKDNYSAPYPVYDMQWQKVAPTRIYFRIEIEINENLPSDITAQVKSMVESVFNGGYEGIPKARIGARINAGVYYAPVISISPDYISISSITISKDGSTFTQSVTPGIDQIPTIQQSDIEVLLV